MGNFIDLTGKKFGRLTVMSRVENPGKEPCWHCVCDCGNECVAVGANLKNGTKQSCGCLVKETIYQRCFKDLTGQKFGRLTVVEKHGKQNGRITWLCKCDCGNECIVQGINLTQSRTKSCGCLSKENRYHAKTKNLIGQRFYKLLVVEQACDHIRKDGVHETMWKCLCDCGDYYIANHSRLVSGNVKSCGCYTSELISKANLDDLTGQTFGQLTVIERASNRNEQTMWRCVCTCGKETVVNAHKLKNGLTKSCGCICSFMKKNIGEFLLNSYIDYEIHKRFECLLGVNNGNLSYDFYLPNYNLLIEYQGRQHYMPVDFAGKGYDWANKQFEIQQEHDRRKREYAESNGYTLIEIPYWEKHNFITIIQTHIDTLANK